VKEIRVDAMAFSLRGDESGAQFRGERAFDLGLSIKREK